MVGTAGRVLPDDAIDALVRPFADVLQALVLDDQRHVTVVEDEREAGRGVPSPLPLAHAVGAELVVVELAAVGPVRERVPDVAGEIRRQHAGRLRWADARG